MLRGQLLMLHLRCQRLPLLETLLHFARKSVDPHSFGPSM
jgi:hypothetical protein